MFEMNEQGTLEQLDYSKMANAANLIPAMKYPYGIGHIYSGKVILFNPKLMSAPDELCRDARSQAGRQARHHRHPVPVHHGRRGPRLGRDDEQLRSRQGTADRLQEGRRAHLSEQRGVRPGAQDRGDRLRHHVEGARRAVAERRHQRRDRGRRKEGVPMYISGFVMPKNAPNKAGAYAYLDAMLAPSAQEGFAVDMGYNPTVTNAKVPDDLQKRIGFTRRRAEAPGRSRLRLSGQERRRVPGVVEQVVQGLIPQDGRPGTRAWPRRRATAGRGLDGHGAARAGDDLHRHQPVRPLAILLRYSLNEFVPAKKMMVEALTLANYVKFFTDPYYTSILLTTVRISAAGHRGLPGPGLPPGLRRRPHPEPLEAPADHLDRAAAVRRQFGARRRLDGGVRQQGLHQRHPDGRSA